MLTYVNTKQFIYIKNFCNSLKNFSNNLHILRSVSVRISNLRRTLPEHTSPLRNTFSTCTFLQILSRLQSSGTATEVSQPVARARTSRRPASAFTSEPYPLHAGRGCTAPPLVYPPHPPPRPERSGAGPSAPAARAPTSTGRRRLRRERGSLHKDASAPVPPRRRRSALLRPGAGGGFRRRRRR